MNCQSAEVLLVQTLGKIFGPMVAQTPFTKTSVYLRIVDEWRVGDVVFLRKLQRIVEGDLCGALGLLGIDVRPKQHYCLFEFVDIALFDGRLVPTATDHQGRQKKQKHLKADHPGSLLSGSITVIQTGIP